MGDEDGLSPWITLSFDMRRSAGVDTTVFDDGIYISTLPYASYFPTWQLHLHDTFPDLCDLVRLHPGCHRYARFCLLSAL